MAENPCPTPGERIKSEKKGRGLARGEGLGPLGIPLGVTIEDDVENICPTPGEKKKSKGKGRGQARGKGRGPLGIPIGEKNATVPLLHPRLLDAASVAQRSVMLEKLGSAEAIETKLAMDCDIFDFARENFAPAEGTEIEKMACAMVELGASFYGLCGAEKIASSFDMAGFAETAHKLATVGAIEAILRDSGLATKEATEVRVLNRGYGVALLDELIT